MTIKDRLLSSYNLLRKRLFGIGKDEMGIQSALVGGYGQDNRELTNNYHGVVYRAIKTIAQATGRYEPIFYREDGVTRVDNHPFLDVLYRPNPLVSQIDLFATHQSFKEMFGESFWYLVLGNITRTPKEIYLIRPDKMAVNVNEQGDVVGYTMRKGDGSTVPFTTDEILHDKDFNPNNPYRGYSTLQAALDYVATESATAKFTRHFFENNAGVNGVLTVKGMVQKDSFKKFVEQWRQKYEGVDNAGKTAIIREVDAQFTKVGLGLNEIDMSALRKMTIDEILMMFAVPRGMLGLSSDDAGLGRGSVETLEYIFSRSIDQKMDSIDSMLQIALDRFYPKQKLYVEHENIIPSDKQYKLDSRKAAVDIWQTRNEIRAEDGLDPVDGGDVLRAPIANVPVNSDMSESGNSDTQAGKSTKRLSIRLKKKDQAESDYQRKETFRLTLQKNQNRYEALYRRTLKPVFDAQERQVSEVVGRLGKDLQSQLFSLSDAVDEFDEKLYPVLADMYLTQGALALAFAGADEDTAFDITPAVQKFIHDSTRRMAKNYNEETLDRLAATLTEGINAGESANKLKKRVAQVYTETRGYRSERIARTETLKASNRATNFAYKQTGFVKGKQWFANPGHCEFCAAFDGKVFGLDDTFIQRGQEVEGKDGGVMQISYDDVDNPPLHPNCRCTIVPIR